MTTAATLPVPPQHRHDARRECEPEVPLAEPVLEQEPQDQHAGEPDEAKQPLAPWRKLHDPRTGCRHEYQEDCRKHTAIVPMMVGRGGPSGQLEHPRTIGVHLMPLADAVDSPRPSVVVHIDERGRIEAISLLHTIAEIVAAIGDGPALVAVDAPLRITNEHGRRTIDELLAWLDVPVFPISRARVTQVWGASRGEELAAALADRPQLHLTEAVPDLVLRLLAWQELGEDHRANLQHFRTVWLGLRPQPYRPKGPGRAHPGAMASAVRLLATALDLGGWMPADAPDDWQAITDAAIIDAVLCAITAGRVLAGHGAILSPADGAPCAIPTVPLLMERIDVNVERMRHDGQTVRIIARPGVAV